MNGCNPIAALEVVDLEGDINTTRCNYQTEPSDGTHPEGEVLVPLLPTSPVEMVWPTPEATDPAPLVASVYTEPAKEVTVPAAPVARVMPSPPTDVTTVYA